MDESDTVEYVREDTFTNSATGVAEATGSAQTGTDGRKPESALVGRSGGASDLVERAGSAQVESLGEVHAFSP